MLRRACAATAATLAIALCPGVASAQTGQDVTGSTGAAQIGSADPGASVAVDAPVTANAPVTVASPNSGGDGSQRGGTSGSRARGRAQAAPCRPDTAGSGAPAHGGPRGARRPARAH